MRDMATGSETIALLERSASDLRDAATEAEKLETRLEKLERDLKTVTDKLKMQEDTMALRQVYHAFNEKCLAFVAKTANMPPADFFNKYKLRNIGQLDGVVFKPSHVEDKLATAVLKSGWAAVRTKVGVAGKAGVLWQAVRAGKRDYDVFIHSNAFTRLDPAALDALAEEKMGDDPEQLGLFRSIVGWSSTLTELLGHKDIYDTA